MFKPEKCKIKCITNKAKSFSSIKFKISVYDELGYYGIKLFYPIRVYVFLSDRNNMNNPQLI